MYDHHINDMISALENAGLISSKDITINHAKNVLKKYWEDKIAIVWQIEDIIDYAKERGYKKVSKTKAKEILTEIFENHDCCCGITWDTIDAYMEVK